MVASLLLSFTSLVFKKEKGYGQYLKHVKIKQKFHQIKILKNIFFASENSKVFLKSNFVQDY